LCGGLGGDPGPDGDRHEGGAGQWLGVHCREKRRQRSLVGHDRIEQLQQHRGRSTDGIGGQGLAVGPAPRETKRPEKIF